MAGTKRQRDLARQKAERQRAREAAQERRNRILAGIGGGAVVLALIAGIAFAVNDDDTPDTVPAAEGTPSSADPSESSPEPSGTDTPAEDEGSRSKAAKKAAAKVECTEPTGDAPKEQSFADGAYDVIGFVPGGRYTERMTTNCGQIEFSLDIENAPETSKSTLFLTDRNQFYDNTSCHRLTTERLYVLQCGDPKGNGTGGPGYTVPDENLPAAGPDGSAVYARGTVAMANAGPGTTGSQFFLVYDDSPLPPEFTVLGEITKGIEVLDHVAGNGTADGSPDGQPKQPLQIQKMVGAVTYAAGS